jgi:hypothetical protein
MSSSRARDAYFTKPDIAHSCIKTLDNLIGTNHTYLEPSAGDGAFVRPLLDRQVIAVDIFPQADFIQKQDFLLSGLNADVVIGNPPFGKRSKLAVEFINRSASFASYIAFILPVQFRKYGTQKLLHPSLSLIYDELLPADSFLFEGKPYSVRCCFQIWSTRPHHLDLRLKAPLPTSHPDFQMWLYNNVPAAVSVFDNDFDFAVPRQGYQDYSLRACLDECVLSKQWMLFKADNPVVLKRLLELDFDKLSRLNTSTPGYGKADVVSEYSSLYPNDCSKLSTSLQERAETQTQAPGYEAA